MPPALTEAVLYVQKGLSTTDQISHFLGQHIAEINKRFFIKRVYVTTQNVSAVKNLGIRQTPCLYVNGRLAFGPQKIVEILTPPSREADNFGFANASPEEFISRYQESLIQDEQDEEDGEDRGDVIRRRMAEFQRKRPEMEGVDKKTRVPGGRVLKPKRVKQQDFKTDEEFARATRVDNVELTPVAAFTSDADGEAILEEYRNETADMYDPGRKQKNAKKPRRRPTLN